MKPIQIGDRVVLRDQDKMPEIMVVQSIENSIATCTTSDQSYNVPVAGLIRADDSAWFPTSVKRN